MPDFQPVATTLRERVLRYYADRGEHIGNLAGHNTLETNSGLVEQRGAPLLRILGQHGLPSLDGLVVVDLGCGFGALACYFALHGARVVAIDPNGSRFDVGRDVAAAHELDVTFSRGRMQDTGLPGSAYDLAVQNNSLCYIVPRAARVTALAETRRILRPGGRLISRNPNRWSARDQFTGLPLLHYARPHRSVAIAARLGRRRSLVRLTSPLEARREFLAAGFVDVGHAELGRSRTRERLKVIAKYHHFLARRPDA